MAETERPTRRGWLAPWRQWEDIDREIERMWRGWPWAPPWRLWRAAPAEGERFSPALEVTDEGDHLLVKAELPGVAKDEIKITVEDEGIRIEAERKQAAEKRAKDYYYREFSYGSYTRVVPLPIAVEADRAEAEYQDGILRVTLPKAQPSRTKTVEVKVG